MDKPLSLWQQFEARERLHRQWITSVTASEASAETWRTRLIDECRRVAPEDLYEERWWHERIATFARAYVAALQREKRNA